MLQHRPLNTYAPLRDELRTRLSACSRHEDDEEPSEGNCRRREIAPCRSYVITRHHARTVPPPATMPEQQMVAGAACR
jgi:hypothetical protein